MSYNDLTDSEFERRTLAHEMGEDTPEEQRFFAWLREVEELMGVETLDGDDDVDGYSLDHASDLHDGGISAQGAAAFFNKQVQERAQRREREAEASAYHATQASESDV